MVHRLSRFMTCGILPDQGFSCICRWILYHGATEEALRESESLSALSDSLRPHGLYGLWNSPGQNIGVGSCSLLQVMFSTQGSKPGLPHRKQILYQLSHQGSPVCRVQFSLSVVSDSLRPHGLQYARPPCLSPTPGVYSNSCPLSQGCHPTSHPLRISCKMLS